MSSTDPFHLVRKSALYKKYSSQQPLMYINLACITSFNLIDICFAASSNCISNWMFFDNPKNYLNIRTKEYDPEWVNSVGTSIVNKAMELCILGNPQLAVALIGYGVAQTRDTYYNSTKATVAPADLWPFKIKELLQESADRYRPQMKKIFDLSSNLICGFIKSFNVCLQPELVELIRRFLTNTLDRTSRITVKSLLTCGFECTKEQFNWSTAIGSNEPERRGFEANMYIKHYTAQMYSTLIQYHHVKYHHSIINSAKPAMIFLLSHLGKYAVFSLQFRIPREHHFVTAMGESWTKWNVSLKHIELAVRYLWITVFCNLPSLAITRSLLVDIFQIISPTKKLTVTNINTKKSQVLTTVEFMNMTMQTIALRTLKHFKESKNEDAKGGVHNTLITVETIMELFRPLNDAHGYGVFDAFAFGEFLVEVFNDAVLDQQSHQPAIRVAIIDFTNQE